MANKIVKRARQQAVAPKAVQARAPVRRLAPKAAQRRPAQQAQQQRAKPKPVSTEHRHPKKQCTCDAERDQRSAATHLALGMCCLPSAGCC